MTDNARRNRIKNRAIAAATLAVVGLSVWVSFDPDYYFFYDDEHRAQWRHPTVHIVAFCAVYAAEGMFLAKAIRFGGRLWLRASVAALLFFPWAAFSLMFVMHAPFFMHIHVFWVWLLLAVLVLVAAGSICALLYGRLRGKGNGA